MAAVLLLLLFFLPFSACFTAPHFEQQTSLTGGGFQIQRRSAAEAPAATNLTVDNSSFVLAAQRTHRKDPLDGFSRYTGGWNISELHYWAVSSFTLFLFPPVFFLSPLDRFLHRISVFMLVSLSDTRPPHCSRSLWRGSSALGLSCFSSVAGSSVAVAGVTPILAPRTRCPLSCSCSSPVLQSMVYLHSIGCVVLYKGQGRFHSSTYSTMDYVVGQANLTVEHLRNFSDSLSDAKKITVAQVLLPSNVRGDIDAIEARVNSSATQLANRTLDNSRKIRRVLDRVYGHLNVVFKFDMLNFSFEGATISSTHALQEIGFDHNCCSDASLGICRIQLVSYFARGSIVFLLACLLISSYFTVQCSLYLDCSTLSPLLISSNFVGLLQFSGRRVDPSDWHIHSVWCLPYTTQAKIVVADTCVAMNEWVEHPHAHTALDDILPCVDVATANESLYRSREVTFQIVDVVNQVIANVSNRNFPPQATPLYYNQSGPLMPLLCNPNMPDLSARSCFPGEVDFNNATQVWKGYICQTTIVSGSEVCTSVGRITLSIYRQMAAAVNVSGGLYYNVPFLTELEDCTFVRETFTVINRNNCPDLESNSKLVYIGLVMVSGAVMLSLIFWVIYARERRHRKHNKQLAVRSGLPQPLEKGP
ncbi:hypothetical protein ZIOFF_052102 [Zingiber officinale]|uniref:Uncharacterized protein n=1 Tax=Zingiber officinale TaxID=94328 RepID=A0A8J5KS47_ZINOF|nr:hypothetical protein ZIOFF_052102 [Zingiber officinale]